MVCDKSVSKDGERTLETRLLPEETNPAKGEKRQ